ncbi:MAG: cytidine/deoxycytidylate deaminase family protein [Nanoarchaeota archaeon]|nr:cytidine/deoxycytidylate deaminase family protein [Nanoarchaeota archaeon]MBU0977703.1 cytidine/deoxycytidylate deaminase family protein [Nanoarchaeota archaeon]
MDEVKKRPSWDEYFMNIANVVRERATCDRGRAGTVIVKDKHILTTGYVGSPPGLPHCDDVGHIIKEIKHENGEITKHCLRTTHSEINAIVQAAKFGVSINGATLYTSMAPCPTCAKAIISSGIKRVIANKDYHWAEESKQMFEQAGVIYELLNKEMTNYEDM